MPNPSPPKKPLLKGVTIYPGIKIASEDTPSLTPNNQLTYNAYKGSFMIGYPTTSVQLTFPFGTVFSTSSEIFQFPIVDAGGPTIKSLNLKIVQTSYYDGNFTENRFADLTFDSLYGYSLIGYNGYTTTSEGPFPGTGGNLPMPIDWEHLVTKFDNNRSFQFKLVRLPGSTIRLKQIIKGIYTLY